MIEPSKLLYLCPRCGSDNCVVNKEWLDFETPLSRKKDIEITQLICVPCRNMWRDAELRVVKD